AQDAAVALGGDRAAALGLAERGLGLAAPHAVAALAERAGVTAADRLGADAGVHAREHGLGGRRRRAQVLGLTVAHGRDELAGARLLVAGVGGGVALEVVVFALIAAHVPALGARVGRRDAGTH